MTPTQDATALADELLLFVSRSRQQEIDLELRQRIVERILALTKALRATSQTPDAVKSLELYADSYHSMSKMDDGKVEARSVEVDLRQNIIPLVRAALSTPSASAGPQAEAVDAATAAVCAEAGDSLCSHDCKRNNDGDNGLGCKCEDVARAVLAVHPQPEQTDGRDPNWDWHRSPQSRTLSQSNSARGRGAVIDPYTVDICARIVEKTTLRNPENIARQIRALSPASATDGPAK